MKKIRHLFFVRAFAAFTILTLLTNIFAPMISYGLTTGPHQPEYTSYEDASSSDMVNLLTGDFTFNMPLLSVPAGSEGAFTVPLSYHAGISTEQEASWVGLGWNINVGSITRNVNGFPDDASGETQTVNVKDLTGRRGWYSNFLGWSMGWDSQIGHYGVISLGPLSVNWDEDGTTVGLAGIYVGQDARFDAVEFGLTVIRVVSAILSYGTSEFYFGIAMDVAATVMEQVAMAASFVPPQGPNTKGFWKYSKDTDKKLLGLYTNYWYWLDHTRTEDMYGLLYLHKPVSQNFVNVNSPSAPRFANLKIDVNGSAQTLKQFPKSTQFTTKGAASDVNMDVSQSENYADNVSPSTLAHDLYFVNGPGVSGSIKPYRLESGSVSVPREMTAAHLRLNTVPFMDYGSEKVPFIYDGSPANRYFHHVGASGSVTSPTNYFGANTVRETTTPLGNPDWDQVRFDLNDATYNTAQRISSETASRKKITQGNYVDWLTNQEIKSTTGRFQNTAYMDYFKAPQRGDFRTSYDFGGRRTIYGLSATPGATTSTILLADGQNVQNINQQLVDVNVVTDYKDAQGNIVYMNTQTFSDVVINSSSSSQIVVNNNQIGIDAVNGHIEVVVKNDPKADHIIGGYVVTGVDGMNYHYSLPVYDYDFVATTRNKSDPNNKYSTIRRPGQFANTWLLTAITGPDFVDRGGANNDGDGYIDSNDWGYWIKFNYGIHLNNYRWQLPYGANNYRTLSDNTFDSQVTGLKEKYYLNSIESRSHVALFIKDSRRDARDASATPKGSLRLDEVALLTREAYTTLTNGAGPYQLADASGKRDVVYQRTSGTAGQNVTGSKDTYIQQNALRRIRFNTDYLLCSGTTNSEPGYGKLTLRSISVLGRNNAKILPDYKFSYANNPDYGAHLWDGWSMYSSTGTATASTHKVSPVSTDGTAWSLTSIKSPLGHSLDISYSRDTYSSISGEAVVPAYTGTNTTWTNVPGNAQLNTLTVTSAAGLKVGDAVSIAGNIYYQCQGSSVTLSGGYSVERTITAINGTTITLNQGFVTLNCAANTTVSSITGYGGLNPVIQYKRGGNIRVDMITLSDPLGAQYKTKYIYETGPQSSGVVSAEPDYIRQSDSQYPFYKWLEYPATPVMYGKVAVLSGKLTTDNDYVSKLEYEFETPHQSMYIQNTTPKIKDKELVGYDEFYDAFFDLTFPVRDYATLMKFEIENRTSKIGKIKSIKAYDKTSVNPIAVRDYFYSATALNEGVNNYQGVYSESTLIHEIVMNNSAFDFVRHLRAQKTTLLNYPYHLQKIVTTIQGKTTEVTNKSWDLYTGAVLQTEDKSAMGYRTRTVYEPVYKISGGVYSQLGSKADNALNKNMMSQIGATYSYRIDDNGNSTGLLAASATTWKKDWSNYRVLQGGTYTNSTDLYDLNGNGSVDAAEASLQSVWRKSESYAWRGSYALMNEDGTQKFVPADKFNFASPGSDTRWIKTGALERFDHFTHMLETRDINDVPSAAKFGYNQELQLAEVTNGKFEEIAFSGAEDRLSPAADFFGGEVAVGTGTVVSTPVHTGTSALSLGSGYGFVFKSTGVTVNKAYRASVWSNSPNGRIYYKIGGGAEVVPPQNVSPAVTMPGNGTWYRVDAMIPATAVTSATIEAGVKSLTGAVMVFDDFRFQPADATMQCYVYDKATRELTFALDNDNTFTRYEYNDRGQLIRTKRESITYGVKLLKESNSDFRRFHVDQ